MWFGLVNGIGPIPCLESCEIYYPGWDSGRGSANKNGKVIIRLTQPSLAWTGAELGKNKINLEKLHGSGAVLVTISILVWFGNTIG